MSSLYSGNVSGIVRTIFIELPRQRLSPNTARSQAIRTIKRCYSPSKVHRKETKTESRKPSLTPPSLAKPSLTQPKSRQLQQEKYGWHFTFLGADQDSFAEAQEMGIVDTGVADFAKEKVMDAYRATGAKVARMRKQRLDGDEVVNDFTPREREEMKEMELYAPPVWLLHIHSLDDKPRRTTGFQTHQLKSKWQAKLEMGRTGYEIQR